MGEEYPRNLLEFETKFATEESCREYLFRLRWPDGFCCPRCGNSKPWSIGKVLIRCAACRHLTSVTAGTIFQDTHTPLTVWFRAMWWVTSQKNGASALGLQRILGLKSYETAWTWLHKFRRAMVRPGRELLNGRVEVDECYIGAPEEEIRGRGAAEKTLVVVAVEENNSGIGRIRLRQIPNASATTLNRFLRESVVPSSVIHTDGWRGYRKVESLGYNHEVTVLTGRKEKASELLPHVHLVISLLKRWLMGTHQGAVSHKHLDYYLDEFTFRFNRRKSMNRGKLFYRLVQQSVAVKPAPLDQILHPEKSRPRSCRSGKAPCLPLKQRRKCLKFSDCRYKTLQQKILQILINAVGWILQSVTHLLDSTAKDARSQIEMITQELIWMLCLDAERGQYLSRKVFQILRHNHVAATYNCGREYMTVIGVWQS